MGHFSKVFVKKLLSEIEFLRMGHQQPPQAWHRHLQVQGDSASLGLIKLPALPLPQQSRASASGFSPDSISGTEHRSSPDSELSGKSGRRVHCRWRGGPARWSSVPGETFSSGAALIVGQERNLGQVPTAPGSPMVPVAFNHSCIGSFLSEHPSSAFPHLACFHLTVTVY